MGQDTEKHAVSPEVMHTIKVRRAIQDYGTLDTNLSFRSKLVQDALLCIGLEALDRDS